MCGLNLQPFGLIVGSILYKKRIEVKNKTITDNLPAFIVAEMAWSHDGSLVNARKIVKAAPDAKVDAIKFHITSLEDYMVPHYESGKGRVSAGKEKRRIYDYLKSINLDRKAWKELFSYAKELELLIYAMCNDFPSFKFATKLDPDLYDIHASCLSDEHFNKKVAGEMKPVFLGIGSSTLGEIEKHVTHDRSARGVDFEPALNPGDLKRFVRLLRENEKTFGSPAIRPFSEAELNYRQLVKKRTVANKDIKKNEKITRDMIAFKRSDEGIYTEESKFLIGRTANGDIKKDEPLTWDRIL